MEAVFKKVIKHCRDAYSWTDDDTKDYLTGWVKPTPGNMKRHSLKDCYMDDLLGNETSLRSIIYELSNVYHMNSENLSMQLHSVTIKHFGAKIKF